MYQTIQQFNRDILARVAGNPRNVTYYPLPTVTVEKRTPPRSSKLRPPQLIYPRSTSTIWQMSALKAGGSGHLDIVINADDCADHN